MDYLLKTDENYPFDQLKIHSPQAIQGGTYLAKISRDGNPILFQTPKCNTKRGIHKTEKKIYCDLLFDTDNHDFIEWLNTMEEHIQQLIYDKKDLWFVEGEVTMEDIEYNWIDTVKNYKKSHLLRTFIPRINKHTYNNIQVYDDNQTLLSIDDIKANSPLISIIELSALKFSSASFHLEFVLRQAMILKDKPVFDQCLIQFGSGRASSKTLEKDGGEKDGGEKDELLSDKKELVVVKTNDITTNLEDSSKILEESNEIVEGDEEEEDEEEEDEEDEEDEEEAQEDNKNENKDKKLKENMDEDITTNNIKVKLINIEGDDLTDKQDNTLEIKNNPAKLNEYKLDIPKDSETINLKSPNEVYLEVYKKARQKAKEAREEAIKAYLTVQKIKKQYLLDEIELSEDESDDDMELLFSEN